MKRLPGSKPASRPQPEIRWYCASSCSTRSRVYLRALVTLQVVARIIEHLEPLDRIDLEYGAFPGVQILGWEFEIEIAQCPIAGTERKLCSNSWISPNSAFTLMVASCGVVNFTWLL